MAVTPNSVEAEIRYLTPEEGGRCRPVASGYRGQFHYEAEPESVFDATQFFPNVREGEFIQIGTPVMVTITFPEDRWRDYHSKRLRVGTRFQIREGRKLVGQGVVTNVPGS